MDYALFTDETGDHNLHSIDRNFAIFCLAGGTGLYRGLGDW